MTTYFHTGRERIACQGSEPLLAEARAQIYNQGFFDQVGQLWGGSGELLATTHQMVYFKG